MIYFTSDLHLGHANCIKLCNRPYASLEQMDEALISGWNDRVGAGDTVFIVGDLFHKNKRPLEYIDRLNGKKILIVGNHDIHALELCGMARRNGDGSVQFFGFRKYFEEVTQYMETRADGVALTLCHYPMLQWKGSRKLGSKKLGWHIYGHVHNNICPDNKPLFMLPHSLNAGVDINGYAPATLAELKANNLAFKLAALYSPLERAELLASTYHIYQTDKSGAPYIEHPRAVAAMLTDQTDKCVGYMHDLLEDTDIDPQTLRDNFPAEVVDAVVTMTHAEGEDYFDYIARVAKNDIARRVKLADLTHNMDRSRIKHPTERDIARWEKYKRAYEYLSEHK